MAYFKTEDLLKKRKWVFIAAMITEFLLGWVYAWSVFSSAINAEFEISLSDLGWIYSANIFLVCFLPIPLAPLVNKMTQRQNEVVGIIIYGISMVLAGTATQFWQFFIYLGIIGAIGGSFVYPQLVAYGIKLYPERKALASGIMTTAYGLGSVAWASVANALINAFSLSWAFIILGVFFLVVMLLCSISFLDVPHDFAEKVMGKVQAASTNVVQKVKDYSRGEMIQTSMYWVILLTFTFSLTAGALVISNANSIIQNTVGESFASQSAAFVSVLALFNAFGRTIWGAVAGKIGIYLTNITLSIFVIVFMFILALLPLNSGIITILAMCIVGLSYGGFSALVSPITADFFGLKNLTNNYGATVVVFGLASILGPLITSYTVSDFVYSTAYYTAAILGIIALLGSLFLYKKNRDIVSS